jgi:methylated-DNA-protein-cysteine methyltransferase-like protein
MNNDAQEKIHAAVRSIPRGRVSTYGRIARLAGLERRARLVGHTLRTAPDDLMLPWHRVINAQGRISFPEGSAHQCEQYALLQEEGVVFVNGSVDLARFGWPADGGDLDRYLWDYSSDG